MRLIAQKVGKYHIFTEKTILFFEQLLYNINRCFASKSKKGRESYEKRKNYAPRS